MENPLNHKRLTEPNMVGAGHDRVVGAVAAAAAAVVTMLTCVSIVLH